MSRVADLAQNRIVRSLILETQERINDRQLQISTLQKSQTYAGISDDASRLVTLEISNRRTEQFMQDNVFVKMRMETTLNSIKGLKTSLTDVRGLLRDLTDDGKLATGIDKNAISDIKISEISDFLNVRINGRFLFAGSKTNTKPVVPGTMSTAPTYDGSYNTTAEPSFYYQGDDALQKARIDEGVVLKYGVTATNSGCEKLIRAVRILRSTDVTGGDANYRSKIQEALDIINQAEDELQELEQSVGAKLQQLGLTNKNLKHSRDFLAGFISNLESADTFTAVSELTQEQTMLEASYATVMRLSDLTLTKFLR